MSSSFKRFTQRLATQTVVYWGNPTSNGFGQKTFDAPVEIKCRWEESEGLKQSKQGEEKVPTNMANMKIIHTSKLDLYGFIFLGSLSDIVGDNTNPTAIDGAYKIMEVQMIPLISGQGFEYEHNI